MLAPFRAWSDAHESRIKKSREDELGKQGVIKGWENSSIEVAKVAWLRGAGRVELTIVVQAGLHGQITGR